MDFTVIRASGSQYLVSAGQLLTLPSLRVPDGEKIIFREVLLDKTGATVRVGTPLVSGVVAVATVVSNISGKKLDVVKFKSKSRYKRKTGFRLRWSIVKILTIERDGAKR